MKRKIDIWEHAGDFLAPLMGSGILLTGKADGKVNPMTIGWGTLGVDWGVPIFTVFVRESRFTHQVLEKNPEFTINAPYGEYDKKILGICGSKSGRDTDKVALCGLTLEEPEIITVPAIRELPLTLECRIIYKQDQALEAIPPKYREKYYPEGPDGKADIHTAYYGEILAAYLVE